MDNGAVERILVACEAALAQPGAIDLRALGFWKAVGAVKRRPDLITRYADRIARIDREAFLRATRPLAFPAVLGVIAEAIGTGIGIVIVTAAPSLPMAMPDSVPWKEIAYLVGTGVLIAATHGLAHFVIGNAVGIRFTHWYSRPPLSPQPGFKTDYATYLRAPARARAWMHASGAIVSKVIPFGVAAIAIADHAQPWAIAVLLALGALQLLTDLLFSTRASDWKKFRREMRFA